jgi:electron transport complex protein RnfE
MTRTEFKTIFQNGLWKQNTSLAQILGLCPLLAISTNMVNGVMLSLATSLVMTISNVAVSSLRRWIPHEIRIPVFILIIAALVTVVDLLFNAWLHELYVILGIFIPLITTNCIVLARVEAFAARNPTSHSALDGVAMGIGMLWTLALLGALREFISGGTILSGIDMVIPGLQAIQVLPEGYAGFLLAALPPGAFILLGCLIAAKNWLDQRAAGREKRRPVAPPPASDIVPDAP